MLSIAINVISQLTRKLIVGCNRFMQELIRDQARFWGLTNVFYIIEVMFKKIEKKVFVFEQKIETVFKNSFLKKKHFFQFFSEK